MAKVETYSCARCGWTWIPRVDHMPHACPRCKQRNWWREPKETAKPNKYRGPDGAWLYPTRGKHLA